MAAQTQTRTCPVCRGKYEVHSWDAAIRKVCSRACSARRRSTLRPWNKLQERCEEHMAARGLTLVDLARLAGCPRETLGKWFRTKGRALSRKSLAKLATVLAIPLDQALKEVGGVTAEDRHAANGRRQLANGVLSRGHSPTARAKAADKKRGVPRSDAVKARLRLIAAERGLAEEGRAQIREWNALPQAPLVRRLAPFRRYHKHASAVQVSAWAARVASDVGASTAFVLEAWRPYLRPGELPPNAGGRKSLEVRHRIVEEFMHSRELTREQRKPRGFWEAAAAHLEQLDPSDVTDGPTLKAWYAIHLKHCPRGYGPAART